MRVYFVYREDGEETVYGMRELAAVPREGDFVMPPGQLDGNMVVSAVEWLADLDAAVVYFDGGPDEIELASEPDRDRLAERLVGAAAGRPGDEIGGHPDAALTVGELFDALASYPRESPVLVWTHLGGGRKGTLALTEIVGLVRTGTNTQTPELETSEALSEVRAAQVREMNAKRKRRSHG